MVYRIGGVTLDSEIRLPSFSVFSCAQAQLDVTLTLGSRLSADDRVLELGALKVRPLPQGWFLKPADAGNIGLTVSEDYTRLCLSGFDLSAHKAFFWAEWLVRIALECLLARRGFVSLHAAAVSVDGKAYAFTGPSGSGKSTRAAAWQQAFGARMISGDRPLIRVDTMELYGVPWDGKEQCF